MDKETLTTFYSELDELPIVELPEDAAEDAFGPINKALNEIAHISNVTTRIAVAASQDLAQQRKSRNVAKAKMDLKKANLMSTDKAIQEAKNQGQRDAIADSKLQEERVAWEKADAKSRDVETLLESVSHMMSHAKLLKEICGHKLNIVQKEMDLGLLARPE